MIQQFPELFERAPGNQRTLRLRHQRATRFVEHPPRDTESDVLLVAVAVAAPLGLVRDVDENYVARERMPLVANDALFVIGSIVDRLCSPKVNFA